MTERHHENLSAPEGAGEQAGTQEAWIAWGIPGHESEYVVHLEGYDHKEFIPSGIEKRVQEALGDAYIVLNRGTRLEVIPRAERNDAVVFSAVREVLNELPEWLLPDGKKFTFQVLELEEKEEN